MGPGALEHDLLCGHHGEAAPDILVNGVAELRPAPPLDGTFAEPGLGELPDAGDGGDLDLVAVVVELVLDSLLDAVLVGTDHPRRREEEGT
ncbi:hypothetical protein MLD38_002647 [Melastoma candidum]|uniref:Uncharacterized protein n=1 Tax=Melastoma candidum TaxID=119954 RepID=A0ACB9S3S5_9MYRT|nr:hypothetical protein MLD38_002647 [Melastoma candidum]